jgi:TonB family protein
MFFLTTSAIWLLSLSISVVGNIVSYKAELEDHSSFISGCLCFPPLASIEKNIKAKSLHLQEGCFSRDESLYLRLPSNDDFNRLYRNYLTRYLLVKNSDSISKCTYINLDNHQKTFFNNSKKGCIHTNVRVAANPEYRGTLAYKKRISGDVKVEMQINSLGEVEQVKALSGDLLLQELAIDAAKQWVFNRDLKESKQRITFRFIYQ